MGSPGQTLEGIADSPVPLAALLLDHNGADGHPPAAGTSALNRPPRRTGELTRGEALDNQSRRRQSAAATGSVAVGAASLLPSPLAAAPDGAIRPLRVNIPERELVDLRGRIAATRRPDRETVKDRSQGAPLGKFQE